MGNHEVSRRRKYYAWKLEYEEKNKEEIAHKIKKFEEILHADKMEKLLREFNRAKFEECLKFKTPCKEKTSVDDCPPKSNLALGTMPKGEIELNVAKELQVKRVLETQEKPSISLSHPSKITTEHGELTKEMCVALDSYVIDELDQEFNQSENFFLKYLRQDKLCENEESIFTDLVEEIEVEYDSIDTLETEGHGEEVIDNNEIDEASKVEESYSKEIEAYYAFANDFTDFYSWIRYLDLYNLFPASVLYDQHVNLMPRGNMTNFALECEAKFLTRLLNDAPETEDGSK